MIVSFFYLIGLNVGCTQVSENRVYEIYQEQEDLNFNIENINSGMSLLGDKMKINDTWDPCSASSLDPCSSSSWNYEMHEEEQQEMDMIVLLQVMYSCISCLFSYSERFNVFMYIVLFFLYSERF